MGRSVAEASIIIEYLQMNPPGPVRLIPEDPAAALEVRFMDRFFDLYVMDGMQIAVEAALGRVAMTREDGLAPTAHVCCCGPRLRASWMRRSGSGASFRWARRTGIEAVEFTQDLKWTINWSTFQKVGVVLPGWMCNANFCDGSQRIADGAHPPRGSRR
jgi:hypothetical protein